MLALRLLCAGEKRPNLSEEVGLLWKWKEELFKYGLCCLLGFGEVMFKSFLSSGNTIYGGITEEQATVC